MPDLWLTCPECGTEAALCCKIRGPLPEHLVLIEQDCHCEHPEDAWPEVWEEAQERLCEEQP